MYSLGSLNTESLRSEWEACQQDRPGSGLGLPPMCPGSLCHWVWPSRCGPRASLSPQPAKTGGKGVYSGVGGRGPMEGRELPRGQEVAASLLPALAFPFTMLVWDWRAGKDPASLQGPCPPLTGQEDCES